ncbi:hypothetical protein KCP73_23040 [Salmonella enterica subsp. enterica]|nr:hypothetical protein KCP73_23040 [Salmonella enterica subsp. enterica]
MYSRGQQRDMTLLCSSLSGYFPLSRIAVASVFSETRPAVDVNILLARSTPAPSNTGLLQLQWCG